MSTALQRETHYRPSPEGIYVPRTPVSHRDEEYDSHGFDVLRDMQDRHFWYLGRHRFLYHAFQRALRRQPGLPERLDAIDLGGGCGGWVSYLHARCPERFNELALADSSADALKLAGPVVGAAIRRYQIDLLNLEWHDRWDAAFLLDVLEHIPEDLEALQEIRRALRPGGLLFVTTPALRFFWSYNDDLAHHVRRYAHRDFADLARRAGYELCCSRYFMFFLSPLLLLSRLRSPDIARMTPEQIREHLNHTHRVPAAPINQALRLIFSLETPLGHVVPFPWGTSILGVFRKV